MDDQQNRADQQWPEYTTDDRHVIVLDIGDQLETQNGLRDRHCHFWSEFIPRLRAASTAGTLFSRYLSFHIQEESRRRAPRTPTGGTGGKQRALPWCKGGSERVLSVVKGRIKGHMQMTTTVVVQEGDD